MVCSIGGIYAKVNDYAQDNYYTQNQELANSQWYGKGAEILSLNGQVSLENYNSTYQGFDTKGNPLRQRQSGKKYNPGRDITLSAPKSVSLLGLVKEDQAVINAHQQAVKTTLSYIERNCIFTRTGRGGANHIQTDNALFAVFQHDDNRNLDPQLHSHCVIFNLTQGADDKWRSTDNRELYQQKMTIGMVYHHELARHLRYLGYELNWNRDGTFDVRGYSKSQLKEFSTRKQEIEKAVGQVASAVTKARACTTTRRDKVHQAQSERRTLRQTWQRQARLAKIDHPLPNPDIDRRDRISQNIEHHQEIVNRGIKLVTEKQITFPRHLLLKESLRQSQGKYCLEDLEKEIAQHPDLLSTKDGRLTIKSALSRKQQIISLDKYSPLEEAVNLLSTGEIKQGYQKLNEQGSIKQISVDSLRIKAVVNDYLARNTKTQTQTLILTGTNKEKDVITKQVRQGLIEQGQLSQESQQISILKSKDLDKFSQTQANSYGVGDVIKFGHTTAKFNKDIYYRVSAINSSDEILTIRDSTGNKYSLELNSYKDRTLFQSETRELCLGEQMRFTRNHYRNGKKQIDGQQFTILDFNTNGQIEIKTKGKTQIVNPDALLYSDYRYVDTVRNSRRKIANYCIYAAGSDKSLSVAKESFFIAASRARQKLKIYTPNTEALGLSIEKLRVQSNALNLIMKQQQFNQRQSTPSREQEFKLLMSARYLVENQGILDPQNQSVKIYKSSDGTEIERNKNSLTITHQSKELIFDQDNSTVRNTFTATEIDRQIQIRNNEMQQHLDLTRTQTHSRTISR